MPSSILDSEKTMDDVSKKHDVDVADNGEVESPAVAHSPSVGNEDEDDLKSEVKNGDDIGDTIVTNIHDCESAENKQQAGVVSTASNECVEAAGGLCSEQTDGTPVSNGCTDADPADDNDAKIVNFCDSDLDSSSHSTGVKDDTSDFSVANIEHMETAAEGCSDPADADVAAASNCCSDDSSAVADTNTDSRDDQHSSQVPVSGSAADGDCAITSINSPVEIPESKDILSMKTVDYHGSGHIDVADNKELNGLESTSPNEESEKTGDAVADDCLEERSDLPSAVTSLSLDTSPSTVIVASTSLSSIDNSSALPAPVAALNAIPAAATSTTTTSRPSQVLNKPPAVSVASTHNSNTRFMSRVLQDIGLLLVSQRVFKDLSSIQKQKIYSQPTHSAADKDMLRKLRASHEKLAVKNRALSVAERRCWCGYRSESANVIEEHRLVCNVQGYCCYCPGGEFVYSTQNKMKKHLWVAHKKVGRIVDRNFGNSHLCAYCPMEFSSRSAFLRHMTSCRDSFWLATNLAPKEGDRDIPIISTTKQQPPRIPVVISASHLLSPNVSSITSMPTAPVAPSAVGPAVNLQLAGAARNAVPGTQVVQIGKQLFALLASNASSAIAVTKPITVKCVGELATKTAVSASRSVVSSLPAAASTAKSSLPVNAANASKTSALQYTMCPVCSAFVKDTTSLLVHMRIAHASTHKVCQYCRNAVVAFPTAVELNSHIVQCHTGDCWICRARFQPPDRVIDHLAERHKVTMAKMLELCRCYLCSSVPGFLSFAKFEEHMIKLHSRHFPDPIKVWERILNSQDANRKWNVKQNADGTLECPHCDGHFISHTFLYRHLHLQHDGNLIRHVRCRECKRHVPSSVFNDHLMTHIRKCSVRLTQVDMSGAECIFVPPAGTRLKVKRKRQPGAKVCETKRVKIAETVVISDDNENDDDYDESDEAEYKKTDSDDEDFVICGVEVEPALRQLRCSNRSRVDRRNSSIDDVREVLESIVDSGTSETVPKQPVSLQNATNYRPAANSPSATHSCNGITQDEVEIIESIVPAIRDKRKQPVNSVGQVKSTTGDNVLPNSVSGGQSSIRKNIVNVDETRDKGDLEMVVTDGADGDRKQASAIPKSALAESSAQQLMARDQITMNNVEEVLEIDGETVLIVQDDNNDSDDDDDD